MMTIVRFALLLSLVVGQLVACDPGDPSDDANLVQQAATSDCGGFLQVNDQGSLKVPEGDPATYCEAERLLWTYDAATQSLSVSNNRILLNCCGDHSMHVTLQGGVYVFTETDAPEFADARCGCMCVFDYAVDVSPLPADVIPIRIVRNVTDSGSGPEVVYEGDLDLSAGAGEVEIDPTDVEPWCSGALVD